MPAGPLDNPITIQDRAVGKDAFGQPNGAWTSISTETIWAQFTARASSEAPESDRRTNRQSGTFRIRWRPKIHSGMRILFDGETYEITGVIEVPRRKYLDIEAFAINVVSGDL